MFTALSDATITWLEGLGLMRIVAERSKSPKCSFIGALKTPNSKTKILKYISDIKYPRFLQKNKTNIRILRT